jgi:hypothetical protein
VLGGDDRALQLQVGPVTPGVGRGVLMVEQGEGDLVEYEPLFPDQLDLEGLNWQWRGFGDMVAMGDDPIDLDGAAAGDGGTECFHGELIGGGSDCPDEGYLRLVLPDRIWPQDTTFRIWPRVHSDFRGCPGTYERGKVGYDLEIRCARVVPVNGYGTNTLVLWLCAEIERIYNDIGIDVDCEDDQLPDGSVELTLTLDDPDTGAPRPVTWGMFKICTPSNFCGEPPVVEITQPPFDIEPGDPDYTTDGFDDDVGRWYIDVTLAGEAVDPEDGELTGDSLVWTTDHPELQPGGAVLGTGNEINVRLYSDDCKGGRHVVTLTATDSDGRTAFAERIIIWWQIC